MANLAELWGETPTAPAPVRAAGFPVVAPNVQQTRNVDRQKILAFEYFKNVDDLAQATTPKDRKLYQSNIDSLIKEIGGVPRAPATPLIPVQSSTQPAIPTTTPAGNTLADLWESTPATLKAAPSAAPTGKSETQQLAEAQKPATVNPNVAAYGVKKRADVKENLPIQSVGELARALLQNVVVAPVAAGAGIVGGLIHTARTGEAPGQVGAQIQQAVTEQYGYTPPSKGGQEMLKAVTEIPAKVFGSDMPLPPFTGSGPGTVLAPAAIRQVAPTVVKVAQTPVPGVSKVADFVAEVKSTRQQMADQFAQKKAPIVPSIVAVEEASLMKGGGAAVTEMNPYRPFPNEEPSRGGPFSLIKTSKTAEDLKLPNQQQVVNIAQEVLGPDADVRPGVVTQNLNTLKTEYTEANLAKPTPRSELLKYQIANEQTALSKYAENRIAQTGADTTLVDPYARGERINNAFSGRYDKTTGEFEGLTGFLQKEKSALYDEVKRTVGTNPIESSAIEKLLNNPQFNSTAKASGINLEGFKELLQQHKTTGFENAAANSINSMEEFRKSINKTWSPDRKYFIGRMVNSIDEDVAKAGGPGLLKQARNLHEAEKKLFASKGIKTMFGEIDPNGVQTATKFEDIPKKLNSLGTDEWKHIYDTADQLSKGRVRGVGFELEVPPEIKQAAQSAKNEMRGAIAREIYEAGANKLGVWNQNSANKIMNARWQKIKYAFDPEEVKKLHTLNYAGQLMPGVHAYEGAALQGQRVQGIIESNLGKLAAAAGGSAGGFFAGPPGAAAGAYMAGQLGLKGAAAIEAQALQKSAKQLQQEMRRNAQLGKNNIKDIGK